MIIIKKKYTLLAVISVLILIILISCWYFGIFSFLVRTANYDDLKLKIAMERSEYNISSSDISEIVVEIELQNIANEPVKVSKWFNINTDLDFVLILIPNTTINHNVVQIQSQDIKIVLKPGEKLNERVNLKDIWFSFDNGTTFNWNVKGKYSIQFRYLPTNPDIYSNILYFNITGS